jgi:hypothetical protein
MISTTVEQITMSSLLLGIASLPNGSYYASAPFAIGLKRRLASSLAFIEAI